jgi:hypothetical protein
MGDRGNDPARRSATGSFRVRMVESLLPLLLILAALYVWHDVLRARERARVLAHDLCARSGVQLLDQTVALRRLRLQRVPHRGLLLRRCYGFEFSTDGTDRRRGSLDLLDGDVAAYDVPGAGPAAEPDAGSRGGNVIELRPRERTLH